MVHFVERQIRDITIVDVDGRLTFSAGEELSGQVMKLAACQVRKIVLNLERVSYIDSAGLGALIHAFTWLRGAHGALKFVNANARTQHVLDLTHISTLVETFASESLAVASFGEP